MKKTKSVICALALAISLSSTVFASNGILISCGPSQGASSNGIIVGDLSAWGEITGGIVSAFGIILGS